MKKIFISIMAAAAVLTACNTVLIEDAGRGQLSVELSASDEYQTTTKATANEDVKEFKINIISKIDDSVVKTYSRFGDMPQVIELLSGSYTINASSPNVLPAAFNQPIYGTSHDFVVKVGEVTTEELVCTLQNVKVTFSLSEAFSNELSSYTISVSNGEAATNMLYWTNVATDVEGQYTTKDITTAGYFTVAPLTIRVDGKRSVDGSEAYHEINITDPKAKDHFVVKLDAKVTGSAGFAIEIDPSVNLREDEEVFVPGFNEDPVVEPEEDETPGDNTGSGDNTGNEGGSGEGSGDQGGAENPISLTWTGYETLPTEPVEITSPMNVDLTLNSPKGISEFKIIIASEASAFLNLVSKMTSNPRETSSTSLEPVEADLVNDETAVDKFSNFVPTGEELTGKNDDGTDITTLSFALSKLVPMIPSAGQAGPGTKHTFTLKVTDKEGTSNQWALTFKVADEEEE